MRLSILHQIIDAYHDFVANDSEDCRNDFVANDEGEVPDPLNGHDGVVINDRLDLDPDYS